MSILSEVKFYNDDEGNTIEGVAEENVNVKVLFRGKRNRLIVGKNVRIRDAIIRFDADDGVVLLEDSVQYRGIIRLGRECKVKLGKRLTVTERCYISCGEKTKVEVGEDCMFASYNQIRTDDAHPIFNITTKERVNPSRSIFIGEHVWLGYEAVILGGAYIGSGSVVGMRSIANKTYHSNTMIAGIPAKVVKNDVAWERTHVNLAPPFYFPYPTQDLKSYE